MRCPKCGKNNPTNAEICNHCKTPLANGNVRVAGVGAESTVVESTEKVMTGWQILLRIALMVAALLAVAWIFSLVYKP